MDLSFLKPKESEEEEMQTHPTPILKQVYSEGLVKIFQDTTGHAERVEIIFPEGKVIVIKDYEKLPNLAHYKKIFVTTQDDEPRGNIDIIPSNREFADSGSKFYEGKTPLGTGAGNIGMAIAHQLLPLEDESSRNASESYVDPDIIAEIKVLAKGQKPQ